MRKTMMMTMTALAAMAWFTAVHAETARPLRGSAVVVDGDTLRLAELVRLSGINAAEIGQPGGAFAAGRLDALIAGATVTCRPLGRDRYKRVVALCGTARIPDLGQAMLKAGAARVDERFVRSAQAEDYRAAEAEAREAGRGLWAAQSKVDSVDPRGP